MVSERPRQFFFLCLIAVFGLIYFILYHIESNKHCDVVIEIVLQDIPTETESQWFPTSSSVSYFNDDPNHIQEDVQLPDPVMPSDDHIILLPDIDQADIRPRPNESAHQIFFLETSHPEGANLELNERKACAIESAAFMHPNHKIFVMVAGNTTIDLRSNYSKTYINLVMEYPNVFFRSMDPVEFMKDTPLETFHKWRLLNKSKNYNVYLADILRLVALWKYGGLYLDTDVVVLRNFETLGENYLCIASPYLLMSGTMQFSSEGFGHEVVAAFLKNAVNEFNANSWASNGPSLVTRVMKRICKAKNTPQMNTESSNGIRILSKPAFLPVDYSNHKWYFNPAIGEKVVRKMKKAYTAHIFNHKNSKIQLRASERSAYVLLAEQYCPNVYKNLGEYF